MAKKKVSKSSRNKKPRRRSTKSLRDKAGLIANQRVFLKAYRSIGRINAAAEAVSLDETTHFKWMHQSEDYRDAFEKEQKIFDDLDSVRVLNEVNRRAYDGWDEETTVEEAEMLVDAKGKMTLVPKKVKRTKKHIVSIAALLWKANYRHGDPRHLKVELTDPDGRPPLTAALQDIWDKIEGKGKVDAN